MSGLKNALVTGQNMTDKTYTAIAAATQTSVAAASAPTKVEFDKTVVDIGVLTTKLNALLTELRVNGMIK